MIAANFCSFVVWLPLYCSEDKADVNNQWKLIMRMSGKASCVRTQALAMDSVFVPTHGEHCFRILQPFP